MATKSTKDFELTELCTAFEQLEDPRSSIHRLHPLVTVLSIAVPAVLCGADGPTSIRYWAEAGREFQGRFLNLPNGLPSRDIFRRVLCALQASCFPTVQSMERRSKAAVMRAGGLAHCIWSVCGCQKRELLWPWVPTDAKSNEITAIPKVLQLIDVRGAIITLDAMGAQTAIVKDIVDRKGDVIICLKGNQGKLYNSVADFVERHPDTGFAEVHHEELHESATEKRHGRLESGTYIHLDIPKDFQLDEKWVGIKSIGVVVRETISAGKHTTERSFYISSLPVSVTQFSKSVRSHWGIENSGHWSLDVNWREDALRTWNAVWRRIRHGSDGSPCHCSSSVRTGTAWLEGVGSADGAKSS